VLPLRNRLERARVPQEIASHRHSTSPLQPGQYAVGQRYRTNRALPLRLIARGCRVMAPTMPPPVHTTRGLTREVRPLLYSEEPPDDCSVARADVPRPLTPVRGS
jgi:hypothetical protein